MASGLNSTRSQHKNLKASSVPSATALTEKMQSYFRRVFERIDPKAFERCFQRWVQSIVETLGAQVIPIDGKILKGSYDREHKQSALHMVSAWASEHRLVLGQVKVGDQSNEITAIPALVELLDLAGCIITVDAMGTQTAIARSADARGVSQLKFTTPRQITS